MNEYNNFTDNDEETLPTDDAQPAQSAQPAPIENNRPAEPTPPAPPAAEAAEEVLPTEATPAPTPTPTPAPIGNDTNRPAEPTPSTSPAAEAAEEVLPTENIPPAEPITQTQSEPTPSTPSTPASPTPQPTPAPVPAAAPQTPQAAPIAPPQAENSAPTISPSRMSVMSWIGSCLAAALLVNVFIAVLVQNNAWTLNVGAQVQLDVWKNAIMYLLPALTILALSFILRGKARALANLCFSWSAFTVTSLWMIEHFFGHGGILSVTYWITLFGFMLSAIIWAIDLLVQSRKAKSRVM